MRPSGCSEGRLRLGDAEPAAGASDTPIESTRRMTDAGPMSAGEPSVVRARLVHAMPGRARLRVDPPAVLERQGEALEGFLRAHPGVDDVRCNAACQSVIIGFDATRLNPDVVVGLIDGLPLSRLAAKDPTADEAADGRRDGSGWRRSARATRSSSIQAS